MDPVTHPENAYTAPTIWSKGLKGGLITGAVLVVYSLASFITESPALQSASGWVSFFSLVVGIILTHKAFKADNGGFMTYGQGLGTGSVLGAVAGLLSGIFSFIYLNFVDSTVLQRQMDEARLKLEDQGMSDEQIDQAMQFSEMLTTPSMLFVFSILGTLFFAFILSLIISAFTKKNHPEQVY